MRAFWKRGLVLAVISLVLVAGVLALRATTFREVDPANPLARTVNSAPQATDVVVLGASRAATLGFPEIRELVERNTGRSVTVLATDGYGILPNALLLDVLLRKTHPQTVVQVVDTFALLSPRWNEDQLESGNLYAHSPLDDDILEVLKQDPLTSGKTYAYMLGLGGEKGSGEARAAEMRSPVDFDRTHVPNEQLDAHRVAELYGDSRAELIAGYVSRLGGMAQAARGAGSEFLLLFMPVPPHFSARLPEAHYAVIRQIRDMAEQLDLCVLDHMDVLPGEENYYDTDHLNRTGAERYASGLLAELLLPSQGDDEFEDVRMCGFAMDRELQQQE
jgi:hypothetical protein